MLTVLALFPLATLSQPAEARHLPVDIASPNVERWAADLGTGWGTPYAGVALSPDGQRTFIAGSVDEDWFVAAYRSQDGALIWRTGYDTPEVNRVAGVAISPDGSSLYVTGSVVAFVGSASHHPDYLTVAFDTSDGTRQWASRYDGPAGIRDEARGVRVSTDGADVFVTGTSEGVPLASFSNYDIATVAYDATTGSQKWAARYDSGPGDQSIALTVNPVDSSVYVAGTTATLAYAGETGAVMWNTPAAFHPAGVAVSPDGSRVFAAGTSNYGQGGLQTIITGGYAAEDGTQLWTRSYDGPADLGDSAAGVVVDPGGTGVFVTGASRESSRTVYVTLAYDGIAGDERWVTRDALSPVDWNFPKEIVAAADGSAVYVTGVSYSDRTAWDYLTVAYGAASGHIRWHAKWTATHEPTSGQPFGFRDNPTDMAISPSAGLLIVTGETWGSSDARLHTIAYCTLTWDLLPCEGF